MNRATGGEGVIGEEGELVVYRSEDGRLVSNCGRSRARSG